jgi:hypothetical protein
MRRRPMGRCTGTVAVPSGETFPCGSPAMVGGRLCSFHAGRERDGERSAPAQPGPITTVVATPPPPVRAVPPTVRKRATENTETMPPVRSRS